MTWAIEWEDSALREFDRLGHTAQRAIERYLTTRIETNEDPRRFGEGMTANLAGLWRYRVGDYRVVCRIEDDKLVVLVVSVGHRRLVYDL